MQKAVQLKLFQHFVLSENVQNIKKWY